MLLLFIFYCIVTCSSCAVPLSSRSGYQCPPVRGVGYLRHCSHLYLSTWVVFRRRKNPQPNSGLYKWSLAARNTRVHGYDTHVLFD